MAESQFVTFCMVIMWEPGEILIQTLAWLFLKNATLVYQEEECNAGVKASELGDGNASKQERD